MTLYGQLEWWGGGVGVGEGGAGGDGAGDGSGGWGVQNLTLNAARNQVLTPILIKKRQMSDSTPSCLFIFQSLWVIYL